MEDRELDALLKNPADRKLEVGLELLERRRSARLPVGCQSVRELIGRYPALDYSSAMRSMRTAGSRDSFDGRMMA